MCDGLSALDTVGKAMHLIKVKDKHTDLISVTSDLWSTSAFYFTTEHLRAHQDELRRPLTIKEYLNCKMDALDKRLALEKISHNTVHEFRQITLGFGTVQCNGLWLTSSIQNSLYKSILYSKVITRYSKKLSIPPTHLQAIRNWEVLGKARKEVQLKQKYLLLNGLVTWFLQV